MKKIKVLLMTMLFSFLMIFNIFAGEFIPHYEANGDIKFIYSEDGTWGNMSKDCWVQNDEGNWYYCGEDGYLLKSTWHQDEDGKWYYLGDDWAMLHDTTTPDGYYVGSDGAWVTE